VNESRPGVCSRILSPDEALGRLEDATKRAPCIKVVAIAGPGEPLANEETFETLRMAKERFPELKRCLSTDGLLLSEKIEDLLNIGLDTLTITMNALDPAVGTEIYSLVRYNGEILRGEEEAQLLIEKQIEGLRCAVSSGIVVKINTV
jgi:nitrogen fixation protein NifB